MPDFPMHEHSDNVHSAYTIPGNKKSLYFTVFLMKAVIFCDNIHVQTDSVFGGAAFFAPPMVE